ncbi:uncharacterized protein LOC142166466 [Nicotiana tabacum]|uniref:Uncharacterized protein LOC142166466 n=1 Tax=Nicotiana tabacum TaxID=4097 RepID=A0AC58SAC9_TOBAC
MGILKVTVERRKGIHKVEDKHKKQQYTMRNRNGIRRNSQERIYSKIDWVFVNRSWLDNMPSYIANFLLEGIGDHIPVSISLLNLKNNRQKAFKYCNTWSQHPQFLVKVEEVWKQPVEGHMTYQVIRKMRSLNKTHKDLNKQYFRNIVTDANEDRDALKQVHEALQQHPWNKKPQQLEKEKYQQFRKSSYLAEIFLQQRNKNGIICTDSEDIAQILVEFYQDLLGKKSLKRVRAFKSFLHNGPKLTLGQQVALVQPYRSEDVKKAIFNIDKNKSPGPDGYGSDFFKAAWGVISNDITQAVLEFFSSGNLLKQLNATIISLIPKVSVSQNAG